MPKAPGQPHVSLARSLDGQGVTLAIETVNPSWRLGQDGNLVLSMHKSGH